MGAIDELKRGLQQARDELKVQVSLGAMEAREEWDKLEEQWDDFEAKAHLEDSADNISAALESLGDELKRGYERLRDALK